MVDPPSRTPLGSILAHQAGTAGRSAGNWLGSCRGAAKRSRGDRAMAATVEPSGVGPIDALRAIEGVTPVRARRGEVIAYVQHVPIGLFVVTDGALVLTKPCGCAETIDTHHGGSPIGPFVFPAAAEYDERVGRSAQVRRDSDILYVPRSLVMTDPEVRGLIDRLWLREASGRAQPDPPGAHR